MSSLIATSHNSLIVGLGVTGLSVARYLRDKGRSFWVADASPTPETVKTFKAEFPDIKLQVGEFDYKQWQGVNEIIISPGVPRSHPAIVSALNDGIPVVGDIELFTKEAKAPIVAITGSNGKTTVTTLFGEIAKQAGVKVKVGGNIGTPALNLLDDDAKLYVLELSSFQLESVSNLGAAVATVLNVTPDHMDRYKSFQEYHFCKQRVYFGAKHVVANGDDFLTQPALAESVSLTQFTSTNPDLKNYGVRIIDGTSYLAHGLNNLLPVSELKLHGSHNVLNALAALALGNAIGLSDEIMVKTLQSFTGLEHRCQFVQDIEGVRFYNDSKATNLGATIAAINGFSEKGSDGKILKNIILIAGGAGKGTDFSTMGPAVADNVKSIITIGEDGDKIFEACQGHTATVQAVSLVDATQKAFDLALEGDIVLLSPACASFDMFSGYEDRGCQFIEAVESLCLPS